MFEHRAVSKVLMLLLALLMASVCQAQESVLKARDSLSIANAQSDDERECLQGLAWPPVEFAVQVRRATKTARQDFVTFPSPIASNEPGNNTVWMEWHQARNESGQARRAPAVIVVHESGKNMVVGRIFATGLQQCGLHAFMIHLPYYGERRAAQPRPDAERLLPTLRQAIADVRRARDAVAVLPEVDANMIAVQGTSLGGFVASTAAGMDNKFDRVFLVLSGGDLFDMLQHGAKDTAKVREQMLQAGLTFDQIKALTWTIEPTRLANRLSPERTWLYSGIHDDVVPLKNAEALARAAKLDRLHHIRMQADHYSGIILLPFVIRHVADHVLKP